GFDQMASNCRGCTRCVYDTGGTPACAAGDFCLQPGTCPPANPGAGNSGPGVYGDVTAKANVHLKAGCYNINSLTENGGGTLNTESGPVVVNIAGAGQSTPFDLT